MECVEDAAAIGGPGAPTPDAGDPAALSTMEPGVRPAGRVTGAARESVFVGECTTKRLEPVEATPPPASVATCGAATMGPSMGVVCAASGDMATIWPLDTLCADCATEPLPGPASVPPLPMLTPVAAVALE